MLEGVYDRFKGLRWLISPLFFGPHDALVEFLARYYGRQAGKVLDLGARRSPYTQSLQGLVVGADLPAESQATLGFSSTSLNKFASERHVPIFARGENLPFKRDSFDVILMIEVIEHIEEDQRAILEVLAALKPNGILVITTPNGATLPIPTKYHVRHYIPGVLQAQIETHFEMLHFWEIFPNGKLWLESVRSVKNMVQSRNLRELFIHVISVWTYWFYVLGYFLLGKENNTTTICLVAKKPT